MLSFPRPLGVGPSVFWCRWLKSIVLHPGSRLPWRPLSSFPINEKKFQTLWMLNRALRIGFVSKCCVGRACNIYMAFIVAGTGSAQPLWTWQKGCLMEGKCCPLTLRVLTSPYSIPTTHTHIHTYTHTPPNRTSFFFLSSYLHMYLIDATRPSSLPG